MVMDEQFKQDFHQGSPQFRAYMVAECVERVAQIFTGTRGGDPSRADDVATVVEALDALWDFSAEPRVFGPLVERVCRFEELVITETNEGDYVVAMNFAWAEDDGDSRAKSRFGPLPGLW